MATASQLDLGRRTAAVLADLIASTIIYALRLCNV